MSLAPLLCWGRVGLGVVAMAAPRLPARPWVGDDADRPSVKLLSRSMGARDLAIGLGGVVALREGMPARRWIQAGAICDAMDMVGTLIHFRSLPRLGRLFVLAVTSSSLGLSAHLARRSV